MNQTQLLILLLVSPFIILCLMRIIESIGDVIQSLERSSRIIYVDVEVEKEKIVYKDRPKKKTKETKETKETNPIIEETISALKSLGIAKKKGREIASSLFSEKRHTNVEDLLKDCLAKM
tara:strand:+ start:1008 stop:1367 length:360 start_codon:yes stop_codon:yes gene_type:complete